MFKGTVAKARFARVFNIRNTTGPEFKGRLVDTIMHMGQRASPKLPKIMPNLGPILSLTLLQKPIVTNWARAAPIAA